MRMFRRRGRCFSDLDELWSAVASVRDKLRAAGEVEASQRLDRAMTNSGHPGEVWPDTLAVLRDLLRERPDGLDETTARACADELSRWP
jgi:thioester reductase-like protein